MGNRRCQEAGRGGATGEKRSRGRGGGRRGYEDRVGSGREWMWRGRDRTGECREGKGMSREGQGKGKRGGREGRGCSQGASHGRAPQSVRGTNPSTPSGPARASGVPLARSVTHRQPNLP